MERSLLLVKPNANSRNLGQTVLNVIKKHGYKIPLLYQTTASEEILREHYKEAIEIHGETKGEWIINEIGSGPILVGVVEGENAVKNLRRIGGEKSNPPECKEESIRRSYSTDCYAIADPAERGVRNILHTSDSKRSARREIKIWFDQYLTDTTLDNILDTIANISNREKILFHGIKYDEHINKIITQGIKPLTPEGRCSFWANGEAIFNRKEEGFDSPFYHYAGSNKMLLAMANYKNVKALGKQPSKFRYNNQVTIKETVTPELLTLFEIELNQKPGRTITELRNKRKKQEKIMACAIYSALYQGLDNDFIKYKI